MTALAPTICRRCVTTWKSRQGELRLNFRTLLPGRKAMIKLCLSLDSDSGFARLTYPALSLCILSFFYGQKRTKKAAPRRPFFRFVCSPGLEIRQSCIPAALPGHLLPAGVPCGSCQPLTGRAQGELLFSDSPPCAVPTSTRRLDAVVQSQNAKEHFFAEPCRLNWLPDGINKKILRCGFEGVKLKVIAKLQPVRLHFR